MCTYIVHSDPKIVLICCELYIIRLHALPVVDAKRGNLVGIVTAKDVMRDVIKQASRALPAEEEESVIPSNLAA